MDSSCGHRFSFSRQGAQHGRRFGARAFLELSFLFILGLALCFDQVRTSAPIIHLLVMTWTLASIVYSTTLMALYIAEEISREGPLF